MRDELKPLLVGIPAKELADIAGVTPEGAQHWKEGHRAIDGANLINLARAIPAVRDWLTEQIKVPVGDDEFYSEYADFVAWRRSRGKQ